MDSIDTLVAETEQRIKAICDQNKKDLDRVLWQSIRYAWAMVLIGGAVVFCLAFATGLGFGYGLSMMR